MIRRTLGNPQLEREKAVFLDGAYERSRGVMANPAPILDVVREVGLTSESESIKRIVDDLVYERLIVHDMIGHVNLTPKGLARVEEARRSSPRNSVFISYSHRDKRWLEQLKVHLKSPEGGLEVWDDRCISSGSPWREEIQVALKTARVAVLLISAGYLRSKFIIDVELPMLLESWRRHKLTMLQIHLKSVSLEGFPELVEIQAVNAPTNPVNRMKPAAREELFAKTAAMIRALSGEGEGNPAVG